MKNNSLIKIIRQNREAYAHQFPSRSASPARPLQILQEHRRCCTLLGRIAGRRSSTTVPASRGWAKRQNSLRLRPRRAAADRGRRNHHWRWICMALRCEEEVRCEGVEKIDFGCFYARSCSREVGCWTMLPPKMKMMAAKLERWSFEHDDRLSRLSAIDAFQDCVFLLPLASTVLPLHLWTSWKPTQHHICSPLSSCNIYIDAEIMRTDFDQIGLNRSLARCTQQEWSN